MRNGKIFQYYYSFRSPAVLSAVKSQPVKQQQPSEVKAEPPENGEILNRQMIDLNEKSFRLVREKMMMVKAESAECQDKHDLVRRYFIDLIRQQGATDNQTKSPASRHLTIETINRYIFCLNLVNEAPNGHIPELEVRSAIKTKLEVQKDFKMDKKTLRKIIENLKQHNFLQTKDFKVSTKPLFDGETAGVGGGQQITKTLLLTPECTLTNEELISQSSALQNPTRRKEDLDPKDESSLERPLRTTTRS